MVERIEREGVIPDACAGARLDRALVTLFPEYSRSQLQKWLREDCIRVDGASPAARTTVHGGERVILAAELVEDGPVQAQALPLHIVYEDEHLLVVSKPAARVVHPGAGNRDGTLQNALLHYLPALHAIPRAGIVHRLDRDTSGLMVVARSLQAHNDLVAQLQARSMGREYLALVSGTFTAGGRVEAAIGRHPGDRTRMAVRPDGRPALTHYRVAERFPAHTLLRCLLESGRTHQIRVHMAHIRHPIVGDPVYGSRLRLPKAATDTLVSTLGSFRRQALHAEKLTLRHPVSGETLSWQVPPPEDFQALLRALRQHRDDVA